MEERKSSEKVFARIPLQKCKYHGIVLFWCVQCGKSVCRYCEPNHQLEHFLPKIK